MADQVAVVVAQAEVRNKVRIEMTQTNKVRVEAGQPFSIRFAYRIYEESGHEDHWIFRLTGNLADGDEAVSEMRHKDRLMMRDNVWAHLSQEHLCPEPGDYELQFQAHAALQRRKWGDAAPHDDVDAQAVGGTILIQAV